MSEMSKDSLMLRLLEAGCPRSSIEKDGNDLMVPVNQTTTPVVEAYYKENKWNREQYAPILQAEDTGDQYYICAYEWAVFFEC